ncbi:MAG: hypothetical protein K2N78_12685 [Oscillospiraceae bacterium]|nr:hypothetical protein [Oscillospiraceae bacterium]
MKPKQLAERIGNMDDRLVQQARRTPDFGRRRRLRALRYGMAAVLALVLMGTSFTAGALAFGKKGVVDIVEVPVEHETIELPEIGLTLYLPDSWKGRYEVVEDVFEPYGSKMWTVCVKKIYDAGDTDEFGSPYIGMLFTVFQSEDRPMSPAEFEESGIAGIGRYLFSTETSTYACLYATDVQFDLEKVDLYGEEYADMAAEMKDIRISVQHLFGDNP